MTFKYNSHQLSSKPPQNLSNKIHAELMTRGELLYAVISPRVISNKKIIKIIFFHHLIIEFHSTKSRKNMNKKRMLLSQKLRDSAQ
jgi:hypothetical protein